MSAIADRLEEKIEALQYEREKAAAEGRKTIARSKNEKAKRMVNRLEDCDESIANLLSQAADCVEALVTLSSTQPASAEDEADQRAQIEERAQDWFATLHEVQMGLRSAVKNLRKAQLSPILHDSSSSSRSNSSTSMHSSLSLDAGSASRGHTLSLLSPDVRELNERGLNGRASTSRLMDAFVDVGPKGPELSPLSTTSMTTSFRNESKLSMSALRLQDAAWKQLAESLQDLAASKQALANESDISLDSEEESDCTAKSLHRSASQGNHKDNVPLSQAQKEEIDKGAQHLVQARGSQDARLLSALLHDKLSRQAKVGKEANHRPRVEMDNNRGTVTA